MGSLKPVTDKIYLQATLIVRSSSFQKQEKITLAREILGLTRVSFQLKIPGRE